MSEPITVPGVYDIPVDEYHADPVPGGSLSSSGARKLLATCPARYRYEIDHPPAPTDAMQLGTAAHRIVLGTGAAVVRIEATEWRTKAIREEVAAVRAAGNVPLKPADYEQVHTMAEAIREHPMASALLDPRRGGKAEQALFWQDKSAGIWRRALLDWLPAQRTRSGRLIIPDYKTIKSADEDGISKAMQQYGYHQQAAWYLDGVQALGLDAQPMFVLIFQEVVAPYLVHVVQPHPIAMSIAAGLNRQAIELFAECQSSGHWPGYPEDIEPIRLPGWAEYQHVGVS